MFFFAFFAGKIKVKVYICISQISCLGENETVTSHLTEKKIMRAKHDMNSLP